MWNTLAATHLLTGLQYGVADRYCARQIQDSASILVEPLLPARGDPREVERDTVSVQGIHVEYGCWECDPPEVKVRGGRTHHLPDRLGGSQ